MKGLYSIENCNRCSYNCLNVNSLQDDELELLNANKREIFYNKGETIFKQGLFISHIVYVKNGLVKLMVEGVSNKNLIVKFVPSNSFIGFSVLDDEDYYPFTAIAVKKTSVCLVKHETILALINQNSDVRRKIILWYGADYRQLYNKFATIGTKNIPGRFAETLLYLCQDEFVEEDIFNQITRNEIAELAGMSVESMLKIMQELKADNIIKVDGKKIEIRDYDMIKRLSRIG